MSKKWKRLWLGLAIIVAIQLMLLCAPKMENKLELVINVLAAFSGIYLTLLIFLRSKENSEKEHFEAMKHMKELHTAQIDVLIAGTERQISLWQQITARQTRELVDAIRSQKHTAHNNEDAVVKAIKANYELSKIDYDIEKSEFELMEAKEEMKKIKEFQFLRLNEDRVKEVRAQEHNIAKIVQKIEALKARRRFYSM